jgi:hypothetical protein
MKPCLYFYNVSGQDIVHAVTTVAEDFTGIGEESLGAGEK